ncbi:hypothetical protein GALL_520740 [mine drainage metagenome]|uniref:Uncharacterized protein n=1 Tax=mine drainage metagenome TaxID=410659 RepID=A0A1J5PS08_9ZZZZ
MQSGIAEHAAGPGDGLVFPGPGGIAAALLLVVGIRRKAGNEQAGIAVGAQCRVNFIQIALAGLDREPVDELAHQIGIHLGGAFVIVVKDKYKVQVAAVTQFLAAELAVGDDAKTGLLAVNFFEPAPAPAGGNAQHGIGQGAKLVGHFFHREHAFDVTRQGAENLGVMGPAQQVQQRLVVIFTGCLQCVAPVIEFAFKAGCIKAFLQHA